MNRVEEGLEATGKGFSARGCAGSAVGFTLLFVANTVFMKLAVSPLASGGIASDAVSTAFLLSGAAAGLAMGLLALERRPRGLRAVALAGGVLLTAGLALYGRASTGPAPASLAVLAAILAGLGDVLLLLGWGRVLARLTPKESLFCVALAYSAGSVAGTLLVGFAPQVLALTGGALCALASCAFGLSEGRASAGSICVAEAPAAASARPDEVAAPHASPEAGTLADVVSFLWKPVAAALLCAFITGAANTAGAGIGLRSAVFVLLGTVVIGGCLVAAICLSGRPFNLRQFYQVFIPLAAILVLCIPFLDAEVLPGGALLAYVLNGCGFALIDIATVSALATCAHVLRVPADAVFGVERFLGALVMFAGAQVQPAFSEGGMRTLCALAIAVFLGAVVVSLVRASATYPAATVSQGMAPDGGTGAVSRMGAMPGAAVASGCARPAGPGSSRQAGRQTAFEVSASTQPACLLDDDACCRVLCQRGALTPRESQVLGYLVRGRGSTFIGAELCISAQTVKTHAKHIYDKLGVHSREELLTLVERTRREGAR